MDAQKIYQFNCLQNIIEKFINKLIKCKLNNENEVKKILQKIINENPSAGAYSFTFLVKTNKKNINASWDAVNKSLHLNISYICNPDDTSLEIIDKYLNSELLCIDTFNKISCLFNNFSLKYKTLKLCNIFYNQSLPKTVSMDIPRELAENSMGLVYTHTDLAWTTLTGNDALAIDGTLAITGGGQANASNQVNDVFILSY